MVKKESNGVWSWVVTIVITLAVALFVKYYIVGNYVVSGESMQPTFFNNDHLIVNRLAYSFSEPKRGDVIVFHAFNHMDFIKRVIGLPGDRIEYRNDNLYVNGKKVDEPYLNQYKRLYKPLTNDFNLLQLTGTNKVPKGKLWVMGDNRQNSEDSRSYAVGFVDMKQVVGKVDARYYPFGKVSLSFNK